MSKAKKCQRPGCSDIAARGAYVLPAKSDDGKFSFALFCLNCAVEAVSRGAKHMKWRPKV